MAQEMIYLTAYRPNVITNSDSIHWKMEPTDRVKSIGKWSLFSWILFLKYLYHLFKCWNIDTLTYYVKMCSKIFCYSMIICESSKRDWFSYFPFSKCSHLDYSAKLVLTSCRSSEHQNVLFSCITFPAIHTENSYNERCWKESGNCLRRGRVISCDSHKKSLQ